MGRVGASYSRRKSEWPHNLWKKAELRDTSRQADDSVSPPPPPTALARGRVLKSHRDRIKSWYRGWWGESGALLVGGVSLATGRQDTPRFSLSGSYTPARCVVCSESDAPALKTERPCATVVPWTVSWRAVLDGTTTNCFCFCSCWFFFCCEEEDFVILLFFFFTHLLVCLVISGKMMEVQQQHSPAAGVGPLDFSRRGVAEASAFRVVKPKQGPVVSSPEGHSPRILQQETNNNENVHLQENTRLTGDNEGEDFVF